jgi:catalase (peroxidase I)
MSFADDFASCLSPLPTPGNVLDSASDVLEFLHKIHTAWENSGGDDEMLLSALVTAGAVSGIDEAAVAAAGSVTVLAYIGACAGCAASAAGSSIWRALTASNDQFINQQVTLAANERGIPQDTAMA